MYQFYINVFIDFQFFSQVLQAVPGFLLSNNNNQVQFWVRTVTLKNLLHTLLNHLPIRLDLHNYCVIRLAFWCSANPKAGQNTLLGSVSTIFVHFKVFQPAFGCCNATRACALIFEHIAAVMLIFNHIVSALNWSLQNPSTDEITRLLHMGLCEEQC